MGEYVITGAQIAAFSKYLRREERSEATVQKYLYNVRQFSAWMEDGAVSKERVVAWKESLCEQGLAPVTVNASLAAVHNFFSFCGWTNCRVRYLRLQRQMFRDVSRELKREEYTKLVDTARNAGKKRLALLLETICATGVRVSEVRYITVEAARRGRTDVSLKGKIRTILIPGKLCRKLLKYAQKQKIASGEIFLTESGKGLSRGQIWSEMKRLCKAAGVEEGKVFPHNLRHLFARAFYHLCRDIVRLADVLGHSSIETTRIYLVTTGEEYGKQLDKLGLVT